MTTDLLRRAAAEIRRTAREAEHWEGAVQWILSDVGASEHSHIALWSPDVAELVAETLDGAAERYERLIAGSDLNSRWSLTATAATMAVGREIALARRILGEE